MAMTVDTLLSSLQLHLTSQAPLIPALHAQLGLPPTALTEELTELHKALVDCIDKKIDGRRDEVGEWMNKCEHLEGACIKLAKALGSNVKAVGSVGELRKQQVLPRRFEHLKSHQDRLHQLYRTKLEQLSMLTNRINALRSIVGVDFFSPEVISLSPPPEVHCAAELQTPKDVTPEWFGRLEKELVRAKSEIIRRLAQLSQTFLQIGLLHEELGIPLPTESEASPMFVPSLPNIQHPSLLYASSSSSAADPFFSASRSLAMSTLNTSVVSSVKTDEDLVSSYHTIFGRFVVRLQEASDESLDLDGPGNEAFGVEGIEPTLGLMRWAEATKTELEEVKARRESHIQSIYNELDILWRRLGVEEAEMDAFVEANRGSTEANVQAYESELERMLKLKRESMSIFIANARTEIERLWDALILGDEERGSFAPFADDVHTEELLALHELEIQRLKEERRIKAPLLASIRRYFEICEEEKELAAAASDQSRLLGRGPRDPGRLLREEKMRKRVMKEKPRLEKELVISVPAWEDDYKRPFLVNGVSILEVLAEIIDAADAGKENRKRDRGGSAPPRGTTPQPGGIRKGTATPVPSSENFHSFQSMPNKRPRLGNYTLCVGSNSINPKYAHEPPSSSPPKPFGNKTNTPPRHRTVQPVGGVAKSGKTPTSSLPRPIPHAKYQNGTGNTQPHIPSYGGIAAQGSSLLRIPSNASAAPNPAFSIIGAVGAGKRGSRRESFKPRPSVDDTAHGMGSSVNGGGGVGRPWAGFFGRAVKEEDEC